MHQHFVLITIWIAIHEYDNFMHFLGMMDIFFIIFHHLISPQAQQQQQQEQQELPSKNETSRVNNGCSFSTLSDIRYPRTSSKPNMNGSIVSHGGTISNDNNSSSNNNMNNCNLFEPVMNVMNLNSPRNRTQSIIGSVNNDQNGIGIGVMSTGSNIDHAQQSRLQSQQPQQQPQFEFENGNINEMRSVVCWVSV